MGLGSGVGGLGFRCPLKTCACVGLGVPGAEGLGLRGQGCSPRPGFAGGRGRVVILRRARLIARSLALDRPQARKAPFMVQGLGFTRTKCVRFRFGIASSRLGGFNARVLEGEGLKRRHFAMHMGYKTRVRCARIVEKAFYMLRRLSTWHVGFLVRVREV